MRVIRADVLGLCFGVRDALEAATRAPDPRGTTVYGELVHNPRVAGILDALGYRQLRELERNGAIPDTPAVLVTAHGISNAERLGLESAGRRIVDTTCPLVRRAHDAALQLDAEDCFVVVVGRRGHVEVRGLTGDLRRFAVVESPEEVRRYDTERIGVICQTTTPEALARAVFAAVCRENAGTAVRFVNTICRPTRERQEALDRLLPQVDALVVVGGRNSRNTRELAEAARARGVPAYHVESAAELDPAWFAGFETLGLTAGTSTLDETIDAVEKTLIEAAQRSKI